MQCTLVFYLLKGTFFQKKTRCPPQIFRLCDMPVYLKMVPSLNFRHRGDKTLKLSSHIILPKTQLCALVFFSRSLNERNMGPNDGTNGSFPPSFQEHGVAPSSGALRRRTLCFAKWSNCFLTRLALKQKCKSVPNHVQPAGF